MTEGITRQVIGTKHWVHVRIHSSHFKRAPYMAGVEAKKWVKELGKARAVKLWSGWSYENGGKIYRESVQYDFL